MDEDAFARRFGDAYREIYRHAARRIADARIARSVETHALLLHLGHAGPSTLSELTAHFDRAASTLSAKIDGLVAEGLLARQRDADDARRSFVWLTATGREAVLEALDVLDGARIAAAAGALDAARRAALLDDLDTIVAALATPSSPAAGDDP